MKRMKEKIKVIAFDADDTLWDCQGHFERVMQRLYDELAPWVDRATATRKLFATERKNMPMLGYGCKAFTLSLIETALRVSNYEMPAQRVHELLELGYSLLNLPATPLPGVTDTLEALHRLGWRMAVFTKGELQDQENKLHRSGLLRYFEHVEITSDKSETEFRALCKSLGIAPDELLMVGNSLRSDIAPAIAIGGWAVYVPFHVTWELEHAEEFDHPHMVKIDRFSALLPLLGIVR